MADRIGFAFVKIDRRIPLLKDIGGPAILCLMLPSILVYFGVFQKHTLDTVHLLMKEANLLYFVIACLVVGSILSMNSVILIQGMLRMFVPLVVATVMATILVQTADVYVAQLAPAAVVGNIFAIICGRSRASRQQSPGAFRQWDADPQQRREPDVYRRAVSAIFGSRIRNVGAAQRQTSPADGNQLRTVSACR